MSGAAPGETREREGGGAAVPATPSTPPQQPEPSRGWLALAGALAGAAGLALSQGASEALGVDDSPLSAVASAVRDLTPGHLAVHLVHLVRHLDKPLLVGGTTVVFLAICAYAGTWARRRPIVPDTTFFVLAALGVAAVLRLPEPPIAAVLAVGVGLITWVVSFRVLSTPVLVHRGGDFSRRDFLLRAGAVVLVVGAASVAGRVVSSGRRRVEDARRQLHLPVSRGTAPAGSSLGVDGIAPWRTPNAEFYLIDTTISPPSLSPADWELRIHGMVEKEIRIGWDDLVARPLTEAWITLCCVSNEVGGDLIGNAFWSGVPVRELLAQARPLAGADAVKQTSKDGWTCGTPLSALTDPDRNAMLAVAMNGEPLPVHHGFPVRMVVPGLYGFVSATKWVVDLEVTTLENVHAYWTERGWSPRGPVKTQSRIDVPGDGDSVKAGTVRVGGSAWAQHTGIEKVEFQVDGGAWQEAELGRVPDLDTWVQWGGTVQVEKGDHRIHVRATDRSGYTQTAAKADVIPNGATGWDSHSFSAR